VDSVEAKRVNNLSPFGPVVMHEQGVGITMAEFEERSKTGTLAGHVGFSEYRQHDRGRPGLEAVRTGFPRA